MKVFFIAKLKDGTERIGKLILKNKISDNKELDRMTRLIGEQNINEFVYWTCPPWKYKGFKKYTENI